MPPKKGSSQSNNLLSYFSKTPSQPSQNAAFASSPAAPSTIQETPTTNPTAHSHHDTLLAISSPPASRSPSPTAPRDIAAHDGAAERRTPGLPQSSGTSTNASKRTFSEGRPVVLNSDSDNDSLTDLEELWNDAPVAKPKPVVRGAGAWSREEPKGYGLPRPPKRSKGDAAFKRFVQAAQRNAEMEQEIAEGQAELDKPLREDSPEHNPEISEKMVVDAVHDADDPEKAKKLYLAMQRTNAFRVDCVFYFFDQETTGLEKPFPINNTDQPRVNSMFQDKSSRDPAFLSGFARILFQERLPETLADWMIDEVCIESSEALSQRYLEILSANRHYLQKLLDVARLQEIFRRLGANQQYTKSDLEVTPSYGSNTGKDRMLPRSLINICRLLQLASSLLLAKVRIHVLNTLFLVCMDDRVQMDNAVLHALQDAIESLICHIPSTGEIASILDKLMSDILLRVKHPLLQRNLVTALPARYPLTASIQRYLALSFLLHPTKITQPLTSPDTLDLIHAYLQDSPNFRIQKKTDYTILAAHFTLLDIALGPGPLTVPFYPIISPPTSQDFQALELIEELKPHPTEVKVFNREVDALAQQIRLIGNGINVAGAITDLSRLAASDACDRLCTRLEHAVRIGGRKMKNIFGREEEDEGSKVAFRRWLDKKKTEPSSVDEMQAERDAKDEVALGGGGG